MRIAIRTLILLILLAVYFPSDWAFARTDILNIRHWTAPDHTRVVIDTSEEAHYSVKKNDTKISIDFTEVSVNKNVTREFAINKSGLTSVTVQPLAGQIAKVELLLTAGAESKVFYLKKVQDMPYRLVIDVWLPDVEKKQSEEREQVKARVHERIVVIDPGHGGEDPGAIGKGGTREKDVVLALGMKIKKAVNRKSGYHAFLTREGDYYVSFKKRLTMAREYGADLFISIHADAARNRAARGSSVYCLSLGGASSEAAKILARAENLSDIIGGSENEGENDESVPIVLNMFQTNTINRSKTVGNFLLVNLRDVSRPKSSPVQEAPFRVLKLPEIPALLLETAYISNPQEERLLRSGVFQDRLAAAIASSVEEFLPVEPQPAPAVTASQPRVRSSVEKTGKTKAAADARKEETSASRPAVYRVRKGDTMAKIAARYSMTLGALLKLNRMKLKDQLYVGREIRLENAVTGKRVKAGDAKPVSRISSAKASTSPPAPATTIYRVKKGDTLGRVAAKHNTTVSVLLKLNHRKLNDPLYVDQKLILPHNASL